MGRTIACLGSLFLVSWILSGCKVQTGTSYLFRNKTFNYEATRVLQYSVDRGVDINEVLQTIARIKDKDTESWYKEWMHTAVKTDSLATFGNNNSSDRACLFSRAHNYYRAAEFFLLANDIRKNDTYGKSCYTFYKSLELQNVDYIKFDIPYESSLLSAVYFPGNETAKDKPLIVIVNGYDSYKEEAYFLLAKEASNRGYSVLVYDGPGQGESIRKNNLIMTHEWEKPNKTVLDYFISNYYSPKEIVLFGYSLGGIFVTRAAAFDKRISGIVNFDVFYDFADAALNGSPDNFKSAIINNEDINGTTKFVMKKMMKYDSHFRWAMTQGEFVFGLNIEKPWEILKEYTKYTIKDISANVTCKVLLMAGEEDHFVPFEFMELNELALKNALNIKTVSYSKETGGQAH
jgi:pimeloyl-ACP methyl ester carboxylesterase